MSARDRGVSTEAPAALDDEGPLRRWSRRKREAVREKAGADEARTRDASRAPPEAVRDADESASDASKPVQVPSGARAWDTREPGGDAPAPAAVEEKAPTDEDMPSLDSLDENSDYSGFLSPGVSEGLRRRALRKLFMSAAFNVRDGLDDYDEDFTNFEALGDIVTSDMRHQAEAEAERARLAQAEAEQEAPLDDEPGRAEPEPAAVAAEGEAAEDAVAEDAVDIAQPDAAGVPGASGHRRAEDLDAPESAMNEDAAGDRGSTGFPASTESAPSGAGTSDSASDDSGSAAGVTGGRRT